MSKHPSPEIIKKQWEAWKSAYFSNNQRGRAMIDFCAMSNQWPPNVIASRVEANKESLTFNLCQKHNKKIKSQFSQLDFDLDIYATNRRSYASDEIMAFKMLINHFLMSTSTSETFQHAFRKCIDYGYSFCEVSFGLQNNETLSQMPIVKKHEDPSVAFWDFSSISPSRIDGQYCGIRQMVGGDELLAKYPESKNKSYRGDNNEVIRYWYREKVDADFIQLKGGEYRRVDLVDKEIDELERDSLGNELIKKGKKSCIYYMVTCNGEVLKKPSLYPTEDLPLVYHHGLTEWTPDGWATFPFIFALEGAQRLHNYTMSQLATAAKNSSAQKVLFTSDHIQNEQQKNNAENFNQREGGMEFGKGENGEKPIIVNPTEIPMTLLNMATQTKQEIDEISGAFIDAELSDQAVLSGKALSMITKNMSISAINATLISSQITFIESICKLLQQMIPNIVTEQRKISVKKEDGTVDDIYVNHLLDTNRIKNNIKDIRDTFLYEISVAPNEEMQQENTIKSLAMFYSVPQTPDFISTKDIFVRNLPIKDAAEFEKRISTTIDQMLIKYSNGEISKDEYMAYQQKQQAQAMQMQNQAMQQQLSANEGIAQAENKKAAAMQFNEETKRMKTVNEIQTNMAKLWLQFAELNGDQEMAKAKQVLEESKQEVEIVKAVNEEYRTLSNAAG